MIVHAVQKTGRIDYGRRVHELIDWAQEHAALCHSPQRIEFALCAYLAGWEAVSCRDSKASHWFAVWQKYCRKRHHGKAGRTLADPVNAPLLSERWHVPHEEEVKAYKTVRDGLRHVLKATLNHYYSAGTAEAGLVAQTGEAGILFRKIRDSLKSAKSFAGPEGLEAFLQTLIELFEQSLGTTKAHLFAREAWLVENSRRRLGGSPATKTLADVVPASVRRERENSFPEEERLEIMRKMVSSMRQITKALQAYLEKRTA